MFRLLAITLLALSQAEDEPIPAAESAQFGCAAESAQAVDHLADAAVDIWAATQRCDEATGNTVKCEVDVTAAAAALGKTAGVIVGAAQNCGTIDTADSGCGILVGKLLTNIAAVASSVGGIVAHCPNDNQPKGPAILGQTTTLGKCVINAKSTLTSIFKMMGAVSHMKVDEADADADAVGLVQSLGAHLAASVNQCSIYSKAGENQDAACASHVLAMLAELEKLGSVGDKMSKECSATSRLYLNTQVKSAGKSNPLALTLAFFLPVTAVLSFFIGKRVANVGGVRGRPISMEMEEGEGHE